MGLQQNFQSAADESAWNYLTSTTKNVKQPETTSSAVDTVSL